MKHLILVGAALFCAPSAFAATTVYSDAASFAAAAGPVSKESFQSCGNTTTGFAGNLSAGSPGPCGSIVAGVVFSPAAEGGNYIAAPGQSANLTTALGVNTPTSAAMGIAFAGGSKAFGADMFQNFGGGRQSGSPANFTVLAFNAANTQIANFTFQIASGTGGYFGFVSDEAFARVSVSQQDGFAVLDNVSFSSLTGAVPEPSTWAMLIAGFGTIGFAMRRRRRDQMGRIAFA